MAAIAAACVYSLAGASVAAEELSFTANVDKTTVALHQPVHLTLTLTGDVSGVRLPEFRFPEAFSVAARSQSTSLRVQAGRMQRAITLTYVLVAAGTGTIRLGPFEVEYQGKTITTSPIEITVNKPVLPPDLRPPGGRFTL